MNRAATKPGLLTYFLAVLHFRQLRGNQRFVLDHDAATDFCKRVRRSTVTCCTTRVRLLTLLDNSLILLSKNESHSTASTTLMAWPSFYTRSSGSSPSKFITRCLTVNTTPTSTIPSTTPLNSMRMCTLNSSQNTTTMMRSCQLGPLDVHSFSIPSQILVQTLERKRRPLGLNYSMICSLSPLWHSLHTATISRIGHLWVCMHSGLSLPGGLGVLVPCKALLMLLHTDCFTDKYFRYTSRFDT